jgi:hypothetical protein
MVSNRCAAMFAHVPQAPGRGMRTFNWPIAKVRFIHLVCHYLEIHVPLVAEVIFHIKHSLVVTTGELLCFPRTNKSPSSSSFSKSSPEGFPLGQNRSTKSSLPLRPIARSPWKTEIAGKLEYTIPFTTSRDPTLTFHSPSTLGLFPTGQSLPLCTGGARSSGGP